MKLFSSAFPIDGGPPCDERHIHFEAGMKERRLLAAAFLAALLLLAPFSVHAQDESDAAETAPAIVELPPMVVSESAKAPQWLYVRLPDAEILSGCSPAVTKEFARSSVRLTELLGYFVPEHLRLRTSAPRVDVLVTEEQTTRLPDEVVSRLVTAEKIRAFRESTEPEPDFLPPREHFSSNDPFARPTYRSAPRPAGPVRFLPNLRVSDRDAMAVFTVIEEWSFDGDSLKLTADWLRLMLETRTPPLPAWFIEGMTGLHEKMTITGNTIVMPAMEWVSSTEAQIIRQNPKAEHPLLPIEEMLSARLPADATQAKTYLQRRRAQLILFLRWVFEDRSGARKRALWDFVGSANVKPAASAGLQEYFNLSASELLAELNTYLPRALKSAVRLKVETAARAPAFEIRPATPAEVGRIKGEWERLQVTYVKARYPEVVPKYAEAAQQTLVGSYEGPQSDPRLLASLGLFEVDQGNDPAAREYLEAAVQGKTERPRVYCELARIRLAHAKANPAGASGKLSVNQTADVLQLLFAARNLEPRLPELYTLIATVWEASAATPRRDHLAALDEGIRCFPTHVELVHQAAALYAKHGFAAEAAALAEFGLKLPARAETRSRFEALKAKLAPQK